MMEMGGNTILTIANGKKYTRARVLQDSDRAERAGKLRLAQRRTRSGPGPRHHGAGLVSGRHRRERLHRSRSSVRDRVLRSRTGRCAGGHGRCAVAAAATRPAARGARTTGTAYVYSSELARGFDILELLPSDKLSKNELAAAKLVQLRPSTIRRASRRSSGRRRSRSFARISISSCATTASRLLARRRSRARSTAAEKQTGAARGKSLSALAAESTRT